MSPLPDPPAVSFASDNTAAVAPEVLAALAAANTPAALAYGDDPWTASATDRLRELFGAPVEVLPCWGGTGANVVGLACLVQPWQSVICPATAHIVVDECGAPARFTGATITPVACPDGKLTPAAIDEYAGWLGVEHHPQPGAISVSQVTEEGTVYSVDELAALCGRAHELGIKVHLDGARLANALVASGSDVHTMLVDTCVDVLTFGMTKNGAMYGELVVFLDPSLATSAKYVRKQAGQLPSKARYVSAQALALLEDDRWLTHAANANATARLLAESVAAIDGVEVVRPVEANAVFVRLPPGATERLQAWSFFWPWGDGSIVRWMTHWATTPADVERFTAGVAAVRAAVA